MWNPLKKKTPPSPASAAPNRVDELANTLQRENRIAGLESALENLDKSTLSPAELESWWHIYGIVAFRSNRQQAATERFEEAYRLFPKSARIRFSLGQQYVTGRQTDRGFELFRSCLFPEVSREYALAAARYAYLWNRYDVGRILLRPFFKAYQEVKILDDHFLYVRGLPFFGAWWSYFAAISILSGNTQELETITETILRTCDDYDFEYLKAELASYRDDQPQAMLPLIQKRIEGMPADFPNAYSFMQRAVIMGRSASTHQAAEALLDSVELKEGDFPWLADIRTLAKAEIAHRFSKTDLEERHIADFIARQGMLFEPDIALNFHLLRFQEHLKLRYQNS